MIDYEAAEAAIAPRLSAEALEHCRRVADTATSLALIYGVDPTSAAVAGLLHDWDRERDLRELMEAARDAGHDVTDADEERPYLLHAGTGAVGAAAALPGLSDEVVSAIEHHTMGAVDMSELDMVVWIADMIEPARSFDGVDALREVVGTVSLRDLFAACYARSVLHLVQSRKLIHPLTVEVWNEYCARSRS